MLKLKWQRQLLRAKEAGEVLGIDRQTVIRAIRGGSLRGNKVGGQWMVQKAHLEEITGEKIE